MGSTRSKPYKRSRFGWLLPLVLLGLTGLFIYMIAIAPQRANLNERPVALRGGPDAGDGADGGNSLGNNPPSSRLEVVIHDGGTPREVREAAPPWIRSLLKEWRMAWEALGQKPLTKEAVLAYKNFFHGSFIDRAGKRSKSDYTTKQVQLAQNSSWVRVRIHSLGVEQTTPNELTVKFHQTLTYSTIKATGGPDSDVVGSVYRKQSVNQLYWRKVGDRWQIRELNVVPLETKDSPTRE